VDYLRDQAQLYRDDAEVQNLLAQAYSGQGKLTLQHLALAESYALSGSVPAAIDQLTLARRAPDATFYDQSLIDAREREWKARFKDEMDAAK
jgi:predicted Zn-dependent protease